MAEVDTSSYNLPVRNPNEVAKDLLSIHQQKQGIEQQRITIDQAKLKQINDQFGIMNNELSILTDGNPPKQEAQKRLITMAKTFNLKPEIVNHMLGELNEAKDVKTFAERALLRGQSTQEKLNQIYGTQNYIDNGQQTQPVQQSQMRGVRPNSLPIQNQIPPNAITVDSNNQQRMQGPTSPVLTPGTAAGPSPLPIQRVPTQSIVPQQRSTLPIAPRNDTGINPEGRPVAQIMQDRNPYPAPSGPATGQLPLFEEGKNKYTKDQEIAAGKMLAVKPLLQALPLMDTKGFMSGPLSEQFTRVAAGLKSTGLIGTAKENDPTAIRQEVAKKLHAYVSNSAVAQRSDAAQTLKEASSPSPNVQILPALVKLTKDAIALDRLEAAMPNAFKDKDYEKYIKHRGTFPQSMDERAFSMDLEPPEKIQKLVKNMAEKESSKSPRERAEATKFFKSLRIAKEQGFYN